MFKPAGRALIALGLCAALLRPAFAAPQKASDWLRRERVRCLSYLSVSPKTEEHVRRTREMGFNVALSVTGDAPVEKLMPLMRAADKHGLHIIWVSYMTNQFAIPAVAKALADDKRRFVGADGRTSPQSPCPEDPLYWKAIFLDRALPLARLAAEGHSSSAGILFDIEDYAGLGDVTHYCLCDECFRGFLESIHRTDAANLPPGKRAGWLGANDLWLSYCARQDAVVTNILAGIRRRVDEVNPDFVFAFYPWMHVEPSQRGRQVPWDERMSGGLGTARAPFLIFDEATYVWGYEPRIETWSADLQAKGLHFVAVSGFNLVPSERVWWPEQMARSAYWASLRSGGYWIYVGDWVLLKSPGEEWPAQFGGRPEQWIREFTRMNRLIAQAVSGKARATVPPIPLPPLRDETAAFEPPDLFDHQHSPGAQLLIRPWSDVGLPYEGGELVLLARKTGDFFSFTRDLRRPDRFEISAWFTMGPDRGQVQLFVGDQPAGEPLDLYAPALALRQYRVLGRVPLPAGRPRFELRALGKNPRATGYAIGLTEFSVDAIGWPPTEWNVILPFDNTGEGQPGWSAVYPPETETNLDATYPGKADAPVHWQVVRANDNGYLDFMPLVSDLRNEVAYALVYVYSPMAGPRSIRLGSDDGGKLWVNDEFIWGENLGRSAQRDEDQPMATLRAGWNKILVKVTQTGGEWGLYFRIYDPDHTLRYALRPE